MQNTLMKTKEKAAIRMDGLGAYVKSELRRKPKREKLTLAERAKRGLICFFSIMLILTFVSRAASEALVAKVTVKGVSGGVINKSVSGIGIWSAADAMQQRAEFTGLRLDTIYVQAGDAVKQGDPLYAYEMKAIADMQAELSGKIDQYKLQIKQLKTGRSDSAESAALSLSQAQRDLMIAQSKLNNAAAEIANEKRQAYEEALFAYQTQTGQRDSQIGTAQQAVAAAQAALDPSDPSTQMALDEAQATLAALSAQWDTALEEPQRKLNQAQDAWSRIQSATYDYTLDLASYRDAVTSAERALETAQFNYTQARENDGDANANIGYQMDSVELYIDAEQEKYDALSVLSEQDGVVYADSDGVVTAVSSQPGSLSTGDAIVTLSTEGLVLTMKLPAKQAENFSIGDAVTLMQDGKAQKDKLAILKISAPDAEGVCSIVCSGESTVSRMLGSTQDFMIEKSTQKQNIRIPIQALREDGTGIYYVLVMGTKDTVLGTQDVAARVDVTLIDHDEQYAAVDGSLLAGDRLIISSNKQISTGDRVVIQDA